MNEEKFNMELRKFLKKVGVTSQRIIEQEIRDGISEGKLTGKEELRVSATLRIDVLDVSESIDGKISLE